MCAYGVSCRARAVRYTAIRPRFAPGLARPRAVVSSTAVDTDRAREILTAVKATPEGFVRTYGDVSPGAPRVAGAVLHACGDADVPWHRIVRADGSLAKGSRQRRL